MNGGRTSPRTRLPLKQVNLARAIIPNAINPVSRPRDRPRVRHWHLGRERSFVTPRGIEMASSGSEESSAAEQRPARARSIACQKQNNPPRCALFAQAQGGFMKRL